MSHKIFNMYFIETFCQTNISSCCVGAWAFGRIQIMPINNNKKKQINSYFIVTGRKNLAVDDGTCLFCPCFTIRVLATRVHYKEHISTKRILFPRIDKFQLIWCHVLASSFKVILHVTIIVPTQTTDRFLDSMKAPISVQQVTTLTFPFDYWQFPVL